MQIKDSTKNSNFMLQMAEQTSQCLTVSRQELITNILLQEPSSSFSKEGKKKPKLKMIY